MRFLFYTHSLVSDWNHGNAHFLRGVMRDLGRRGHEAIALEPVDGWSRTQLLRETGGPAALKAFATTFPDLVARTYDSGFDHEAAIDGADVVIVHEWTDPALVRRLGLARKRGGRFTLLFHDTHHRAVSATGEIAGLELDGYDGVLVFGQSLKDRYQRAGWGRAAHVWHEAADDSLFRPMPGVKKERDLVWVGNWGDGERSAQIEEFLVAPVEDLGLTATVRGVRYPASALERLAAAGISCEGWVPNAEVPRMFAESRVTVHIPRGPYVQQLPGIPTIRVFEALACGIPLVCAPWEDREGLFRPGQDYLMVQDGAQMRQALRDILNDPDLAASLATSGLETILKRHTCRHRVDELLALLGRFRGQPVARPLEEIAK